MSGSENNNDDLEKINDIGPAFAKALHAVGISTFTELAAHTPEELARIITENTDNKVTPERIKTKNWIQQAKDLSWKPYAEFSVFFDYRLDKEGHKQWHTRVWKTRTYYNDVSGQTEEFDGIETGKWVNWILDKAKLDVERLPQSLQKSMSGVSEKETAPEEPNNPPVSIEIQDITLYPTDRHSKNTITADIRLKLSGHNHEELLEKQASFQLEIHTVNLQNGIAKQVGLVRRQFEPDKPEYIISLEFPIPEELGRYELQTFVFLLPPEKGIFFKGHTFKVVP